MFGGSVTLIVFAALFWGIAGGIGAILLNEGWGPAVVSFYRGAVGLLFVIGWLCLRPRRHGLKLPRLWLWSILAGLGIAGNFGFYFISIGEGSVSISVTLMYCAPIFVYLFSFLFGLEYPTWSKVFGIVTVMVGVILLTQLYHLNASQITLWGVTAGLLSGLSYTLFIFSFKYGLLYGSPQSILTIAFSVLALLCLYIGSIERVLSVLQSSDINFYLALGMLGGGLSFVFYLLGLKHISASLASIVATIEPVTASLFGVMLLDERLSLLQVLGMTLILFAVTLMSVGLPKRMKRYRWLLRRKLARH